MKVIRADLPEDLDSIELHLFADEHIGDENCDIERLKNRIEYVRGTPNAYCVLNGDILNNAVRTGVSDIYSEKFTPRQALNLAVELFMPIKDKIIAITHGNHENRTYKDSGINLSEMIALELGLQDRFTPTSTMIFLRFGQVADGKRYGVHGSIRKVCYTIYMLHGSGGGRREGAKLNRLAEMSGIIDADIYIHSHTHLPMIMKEAFYRTDARNSAVACIDKLFVNTASNLNYGGYGEAAEFKPNSKAMPVIYLDGHNKEFTAKL